MTDGFAILQGVLIGHARERGMVVEESSRKGLSPAHLLQQSIGMEPQERPPDTNAVMTGCHHFLFARMIETSVDAIRVRVRDLHQWAGAVRAALRPSHADEMSLVLVCPVGSSEDTRWQAFASTVERDDRICRKLVWMPSDVSALELEAEEFVGRTFLARPWANSYGGGIQELDVAERFRLAVENRSGIDTADARLAANWWPLLVALFDHDGEPVAPGVALVRRLIDSLDRES